jgi:hypothetical protein
MISLLNIGLTICLNLQAFLTAGGQAGGGLMYLITEPRFRLQTLPKNRDHLLRGFYDGWYQKNVTLFRLHKKGPASGAPHFFGKPNLRNKKSKEQ